MSARIERFMIIRATLTDTDVAGNIAPQLRTQWDLTKNVPANFFAGTFT